ncbi:MAG: thioredoxin family protein [Bacteroidales bacterium]
MIFLSTAEALSKAISSNPGMLIYFYDDRCLPCVSLRPKVESMVKEKFPKMELVWVNAKDYPNLPAVWGVFASPTILVFFEGKEFRRFSKFVSIAELEQAIQRYYAMVF